MMNHSRLVIVALFLLPLTALICGGCSDSDEVTYGVTGTVRDLDGNPVPNARVAIEYQYDVDTIPALSVAVQNPQPTKPLIFQLSVASDWLLQISDYSGKLIREYSGHDEAGLITVTWDGTDATGQPQPSGVYRERIEAGESVAKASFFWLLSFELMRDLDAWLVITDSDGKFAIPWSLIPIGEFHETLIIPPYDNYRYTISDSVRVCAWDGGASISQSAVLKRGHTIPTELVIQ